MTFDDYAKNWDDERRIKRAKMISQTIKDYVTLTPEMNCLEFGCGTGLVGLNLSEAVGHIDMVDVSEKMIEVLDQRIDEAGMNNITSYHKDLLKEHHSENSYDLIFSSMVFHHIPETEKLIKRMMSLLTFSGQVCIVDFAPLSPMFHKNEHDFEGHDGFDIDELMALMALCGLKDIKGKIFYKGQKHIDDQIIDYKLLIVVGNK